MGVMASLKESAFGKVIIGAGEAFFGMLNFEYDEDLSVEKAIKDTIKANPEMNSDLEKIKNDIELNDIELDEQAKELFGEEKDRSEREREEFAKRVEVEIPDDKIQIREKTRSEGEKDRSRGREGKQRIR